jgi:hypothetical protein
MLLEDLLIQSGTDYEPVRGNSDEVLMPCPFCTGSVDSSGTRLVFGLNLINGKAHCFRCDWKSSSPLYTARELCRAWGIDFSWRLRLSASEAQEAVSAAPVEPQRAIPSGLPEEYERFHFPPIDDIEQLAYDYVLSRHITRQEIEDYQIGFAAAGDKAWRILFPVFGEDNLVYGCTGRDFSGKSALKYKNTDGIKLLFNGQHKAKTAVVVEGPTDTLAVARVLLRQFPHTVAVGALGSVITVEQLAQLSKYEHVIHFPDFDAPGVKGACKRADITTEAGIKTSVIIPDSMTGDDPGSLDGDTIAAYLRVAQPWTKSQKLRMRLRSLK